MGCCVFAVAIYRIPAFVACLVISNVWACRVVLEGGFTVTGMVVSAHSSVVHLVYQLGQVEWGPLSAPCLRGTRAILDALARAMYAGRKDLKGEIDVTAEQLMRTAGYKERWTRLALHTLEDSGVIVWKRGGIRDGKPEAGLIRIVKRVLVQWIQDALPDATRRQRKRHQRTMNRLEKIHLKNLSPRLRWSDHAALNASPLSKDRDIARAHRAPAAGTKKKIGKKMAKSKQSPESKYLPKTCRHGNGKSVSYPQCRSIALHVLRGITDTGNSQDLLPLLKDYGASSHYVEQPHLASPPRRTAFDEYMSNTYPDATPREWARLVLHDSRARELAANGR